VSDDEILLEWAKRVQKVEPDAGSASTVFRRVKLHEAQVREAAGGLRILGLEQAPVGAQHVDEGLLHQGPARAPPPPEETPQPDLHEGRDQGDDELAGGHPLTCAACRRRPCRPSRPCLASGP